MDVDSDDRSALDGETAQGGVGEAGSAKAQTRPAIDIGQLADRVYRMMREELRLDTVRGVRTNRLGGM